MLTEHPNRVKQNVRYDTAKPQVMVTDKGQKASPLPGTETARAPAA